MSGEFDPAELAKLAEAATPGPWNTYNAHGHKGVAYGCEEDGDDGLMLFMETHGVTYAEKPDAEFIAYCGTYRSDMVVALTRADETEKAVAERVYRAVRGLRIGMHSWVDLHQEQRDEFTATVRAALRGGTADMRTTTGEQA